MPKIPDRLKEIADELDANIGEETDDLQEVVAFLQFCLDNKRAEVNEPLDAMEAELEDFCIEDEEEHNT